MHALFECPLAAGIWEGSDFSRMLWSSKFRCPVDCFVAAKKELPREEVEEFVGVMWEIWNARNRFIFKTPDANLALLSKRAIAFVRSYRASIEQEHPSSVPLPSMWQPPASGLYKLNFDGGAVSGMGWGWGFVIRNSMGDVVLAGVQQGPGFAGDRGGGSESVHFWP